MYENIWGRTGTPQTALERAPCTFASVTICMQYAVVGGRGVTPKAIDIWLFTDELAARIAATG